MTVALLVIAKEVEAIWGRNEAIRQKRKAARMVYATSILEITVCARLSLTISPAQNLRIPHKNLKISSIRTNFLNVDHVNISVQMSA